MRTMRKAKRRKGGGCLDIRGDPVRVRNAPGFRAQGRNARMRKTTALLSFTNSTN